MKNLCPLFHLSPYGNPRHDDVRIESLIPIVIWKFPQRGPTYSQALEQHRIKRQRVEIQIVREADNMMRRRFGWLHACAWTETMHCRNETAVNDACNVTHRSRVETMSCREIAKAVESQGGAPGLSSQSGLWEKFLFIRPISNCFGKFILFPSNFLMTPLYSPGNSLAIKQTIANSRELKCAGGTRVQGTKLQA